ncbi:SGNH/GDSL hydrolase family protein [Bradyrhizobium prioriisuperbiae]|uniref:SGNH/GDSL hydrolase family protein n=1 Tax=Bradyrhizobium prioriisuperbiae TaxID=2854389 RepID=UPI0028E90828|nr:SGNH/GDSL hydrolase family protein [Bradyrhizobium prioritasuperba]
MTISSSIKVMMLLAGLVAGGSARAEDAKAPVSAPAMQDPSLPQELKAQPSQPETKVPPAASQEAQAGGPNDCEVPAYLLASENPLTKVADAIKTRQRLDILVVGSGSSVLAGPDGLSTSYPARLEKALREKLTGVTVNVSTDIQVKKTAAEAAEGLEKLAKDRKPTLVIWQTGTVDAVKSVDPDDFRAAIDDGVTALQGAGSDVLLMNLQYSPRMETMITVAPYLDNMRVGAQEHNVPLFDRFAIMRHWNESGLFDLFNTHHGFGLAKRVHECLGQTLAAFVIEAAHVNTAELRIQR